MTLNTINLSHLNPNQIQVVIHDKPNTPLLVLAAAGTGKTETLTTRIAYMIREHHVPPDSIMAVTFTKKAAREMAERAARLARVNAHELTIGTFHGICATILRQHPMYAGHCIIGEHDSHKVIEHSMKQNNGIGGVGGVGGVGGNDVRLEAVIKQLSTWRNDGLNPTDIDAASPVEAYMLEVYRTYRHTCTQQQAIDFDDLILHTVTIFKTQPAFKEQWTNQWRHIMVDEFQDTNIAQLMFLKHLVQAPTNASFMAVGDDAQAIHEWRGARVENILTFGRHFPNAETLKLELNYRSVGTILHAANNLIKFNEHTTDKKLKCTKDPGHPIQVHSFHEEFAEAQGIATMINRMIDAGIYEHRDMAVLYRVNAMSLPIERALRDAHIPFKLKGSISFFDRAEIRTIMAYLRLAANPQSDADFKRALTTPARGFGTASIKHLEQLAHNHNPPLSLFHAAYTYHRVFKGKVREALRQFLGIFRVTLPLPIQDPLYPQETFTQLPTSMPYTKPGEPYDMVTRIIDNSDYTSYVLQQEDMERWENIQELLTTIRTLTDERRDIKSLAQLIHVLAQDYQDDMCPQEADDGLATHEHRPNKVTLMTLHASKGLEFPVVFMTGISENTLPHFMSIKDKKIDEERRLAYVGITRAKERLYMTYPRKKHTQRGLMPQKPSRFIAEMRSKVEFVEHEA